MWCIHDGISRKWYDGDIIGTSSSFKGLDHHMWICCIDGWWGIIWVIMSFLNLVLGQRLTPETACSVGSPQELRKSTRNTYGIWRPFVSAFRAKRARVYLGIRWVPEGYTSTLTTSHDYGNLRILWGLLIGRPKDVKPKSCRNLEQAMVLRRTPMLVSSAISDLYEFVGS